MITPDDQPGTLIGYARVSTSEQNLDLQTDALIRAGVDRAMIFTDKVSGIAKRRPGRDSAIRQARPGDTLVVWKLDRVSRSLLDLLTLLQALEAAGIKFRSLTETLDTSGPMGRAVVAILGAVAQLERDMIQQRSKAGVKRAMERGVRFGQPTIFTDAVQAKIAVWVREQKPIPWIANQLKCHPGTIRRVYTFPVLEALRAGKKVHLQIQSKDRGRK